MHFKYLGTNVNIDETESRAKDSQLYFERCDRIYKRLNKVNLFKIVFVREHPESYLCKLDNDTLWVTAISNYTVPNEKKRP